MAREREGSAVQRRQARRAAEAGEGGVEAMTIEDDQLYDVTLHRAVRIGREVARPGHQIEMRGDFMRREDPDRPGQTIADSILDAQPKVSDAESQAT